MDNAQFHTYKSKRSGKETTPLADTLLDEHNEELIDFVIDLVGFGLSRFKIKQAVEIEFKCSVPMDLVKKLVKTARKRIIAHWEGSPSGYRGNILAGLQAELSDPSAPSKRRLQIFRLLIQLGGQLPDALPTALLNKEDWVTKTPAEIAKAMDNSVPSVPVEETVNA